VDGAVTADRIVPQTVAEILAAHRSGHSTPEQTLAQSFARIRAHSDPAVYNTLRDEAVAVAEGRSLAR
jgi:allophanate hydrolase